MAVIPLQDILELDGAHRMNVPGVSGGNWTWRFSWEQLRDEQCQQLREWIQLYGRAP
jgi:4-alpha-glucanotransferase